MPGIYIHIPFCDGKCPYCDFYSLRGSEELKEQYTEELCRRIRTWPEEGLPVETVYFGGGTPNLLGAPRLGRVLEAVGQRFALSAAAEVTLEANPTHVDRAFFRQVRAAGFNRLSMGLQSANEEELRLPGRAHSTQDVTQAVADARAAGFENLSLDLMLGLPRSSPESLEHSVEFAAGLEPEHLSSYLLKVEEGTPFAARGIRPLEEDLAANQYLFLVQKLDELGYRQYEISNFARPGRESRHNLVYWHDQEYLGFGPGAHSFWQGKRFYCPRDLEGFLRGNEPVQDGPGGSFEEFVMLGLRLTEGISRERCEERFGEAGIIQFRGLMERARKLPQQLVRLEEERLSFTPEGFLVSNALLGELL